MNTAPKSAASLLSNPVATLCLAGFLWSFSGILIKLLNCNAFVIAGARAGIAVVIQIVYLNCIGTKLQLPKTKAEWLAMFALLTNIFCLIFAFQLTSAANAVFLHYSGMVLIAFLAPWFLKEKTSKRDWLAILLAFAGIYFLAGTQFEPRMLAGNILGVCCGITFAIIRLCWRYIGRERSHVELVNVCIISDLITVFISIAMLTFFVPAGDIKLAQNWPLFIALGIIPWALPNILECRVIGQVPAVKATVVTMLDPTLTAFWPMLFLAEFPTMYGYVGCVLILAAIIISQYTQSNGRINAAPTEKIATEGY